MYGAVAVWGILGHAVLNRYVRCESDSIEDGDDEYNEDGSFMRIYGVSCM